MHVFAKRLCVRYLFLCTSSPPHCPLAVTAAGSHSSYTSHWMPQGFLAMGVPQTSGIRGPEELTCWWGTFGHWGPWARGYSSSFRPQVSNSELLLQGSSSQWDWAPSFTQQWSDQLETLPFSCFPLLCFRFCSTESFPKHAIYLQAPARLCFLRVTQAQTGLYPESLQTRKKKIHSPIEEGWDLTGTSQNRKSKWSMIIWKNVQSH